jgi:hypothetical protein
MLMPNPDNERRTLSIDDFLRSIKDFERQRIYARLLAPLEILSTRINATWPTPDGMPDIRIVRNASAEETELRDMVNTVCLAEGLLDRSLAANSQASEKLGASKLPKTLGPLSIAKLSIMWSCAHEIFHYLRRHELVEKHFGNDAATKHALEYDADLCAVAAIYRYLRFFSSNKSAIQVKQTVFEHLYWQMRLEVDRTDTHFHGSQTHPHAATRLLDFVSKLATMHDSNLADPEFRNPLSHLHFNKLLEVLVKLELGYINAIGVESQGKFSPIVDFARENIGLAYTSERHNRWDEISPLITRFVMLPRGLVSNESSIAFFGDIYSLPRGI